MLAEQVTRAPQHRGEMLAAIDPVDETSKTAAELGLVCGRNRFRRFGAQGREHPIDAPPGRDCIAERKARRDEAGDLLVARIPIAVDAIDRVSLPCRLCVASSEQRVQAFADTVHFAEVLAILPSQLQ